MAGKNKKKAKSKKTKNVASTSNQLTNMPKSDLEHTKLGDPIPNQGQTSHNPNASLVQTQCNVKSELLMNLILDLEHDKFCTEIELEGTLQKKLEVIYNEAYLTLLQMGHRREVAVNAIFTNGHGGGKWDKDILSTIVDNSVTFITTGMVGARYAVGYEYFADLKVLAKNSLGMMITWVCEARSGCYRGDAMWCILSSNFHLGIAVNMQVPSFVTNEKENVVTSASETGCKVYKIPTKQNFGVGEDGNLVRENVLERDVNYLTMNNLTPYMAHQFKDIILKLAEECRKNMKTLKRLKVSSHATSTGEASKLKSFEWESSCMARSVVDSFNRMSLGEQSDAVDEKDKGISVVVEKIEPLKQQDKKKWAQEKVIQAARKLIQHFIELRMLSTERDVKQLKGEGYEIWDETMDKVRKMEDELIEAGRIAQNTTSTLKRLQFEASEIKAEKEAFKLSKLETDKKLQETETRMRKVRKKLAVMERQIKKLQEEFEEDRNKNSQLQQEFIQHQQLAEKSEAKVKEQIKGKEILMREVQEAQRMKKEDEERLRRKKDAMHCKMEIDCQRPKDDNQRLEQEISRLEMSQASTKSASGAAQLPRGKFDEVEECSELSDRRCLICMVMESSFIFLPCAHQVVCASCNENHRRAVGAKCPSCRDRVKKRVGIRGIAS